MIQDRDPKALHEDRVNLRFHWMLPKGGEVAVETAKETAAFRARCHGRTSPARQTDMVGWGQACTLRRSCRG